ncbi:hypothetical protein QBC40DRAFT_302354 [Triangularia verruculosa]|uniref:Uncharacterized protein n=1 Tax=Triangularia verruculosa TaxID=2587418 RepID=A0AAN6X686_9PEZI|nr:hypothetical protein QBC40DRAFT_302354 [Triangularia verruculosa]
MPPPKTYILPPTFDLPPETSIKLGNLLSTAFTPHRPLATLPTTTIPLSTTVQTNLTTTHSTALSANTSLSAHLLSLAGLSIASEFSVSGTTTYSAAKVTTTQFSSPTSPSEDDIQALILATPRAKRILFDRVVGGKLFMITGIKTAEGFTVNTETGVKKGGSLGGDVPIGGTGVGIGAEVGVVREKGDGEGYTVEGEVVIGYRVLVVRRRGWRRGEGEVELGEYRSRERERMLGDEEENEEEEDGIEVGEGGVEDIGFESGDEDEDVALKTVVVDSDEGEVVVCSMGDGVAETV